MVGGLADWFAITALFRHPLNIPIPHTAIIPNRKDRIGRTLGNFVQHNFLSPEVLGPQLLAVQPSRRVAEWLRRPENARSVARHAASALRSATDVVRDEDVHALLERSVIEPLRQRPIAPVLAKGLVLLTANDRHQQLLDRVINGLAELIVENEEFIRHRIHDGEPLVGAGIRGREGARQGRRRHPAHAARGRRRSGSPAAAAVRRPAHRLDRPPSGVARGDRAGRRGEAAAVRQPHQPEPERVALGRGQAGPRPARPTPTATRRRARWSEDSSRWRAARWRTRPCSRSSTAGSWRRCSEWSSSIATRWGGSSSTR